MSKQWSESNIVAALILVVAAACIFVAAFMFVTENHPIQSPDWKRIDATVERMEYLIKITDQRIEILEQLQIGAPHD